MSTEDDGNPYELLAVSVDATEQDIKSAYRKLSLKVHPDRNPNNPNAARKFHELNQAYEFLLDPLRRLALDAKLRTQAARKARYAAYDSKRKKLQDELEEREKDFKRQRKEKVEDERQRQEENERIQEEGRKLRESRQQKVFESSTPAPADPDAAPEIGSLDTTVRVRISTADHSKLTTVPGLSSLLQQFGIIDSESVIISKGKNKKDPTKPAKYATALVPFKQIGAAFAAVCASDVAARGLQGVTISWAGKDEPPIIGWLKKQGKLGQKPPPSDRVESTPITSSAPKPRSPPTYEGESAFSSFPDLDTEKPASTPKPSLPSGLDFESVVLMRMRQAERERLEREIREKESMEEDTTAS